MSYKTCIMDTLYRNGNTIIDEIVYRISNSFGSYSLVSLRIASPNICSRSVIRVDFLEISAF